MVYTKFLNISLLYNCFANRDTVVDVVAAALQINLEARLQLIGLCRWHSPMK